MTRGCIFYYDGVGKCLGHPEVDDERYPRSAQAPELFSR